MFSPECLPKFAEKEITDGLKAGKEYANQTYRNFLILTEKTKRDLLGEHSFIWNPRTESFEVILVRPGCLSRFKLSILIDTNFRKFYAENKP